jgi:hypothetical protein
MTVRFVVHEICRPSLYQWRSCLAQNRRGSTELANLYFESLETELIRSRGRPARALAEKWLHPPITVWEFQFREAWVVYTLKESGGWLAKLRGRQVTEVILLSILDHLPRRVELELLAKALGTWGRSSS